MKKLIVMLMSVVGSVSLSAAPDNAAKQVAVIVEGDLVKVIYDGLETCSVTVTISNDDGNQVFSESIRTNGFIRPYKFSNLPEGEYVIQVEDTNGIFQEIISYKDTPWIAQLTRLGDSGERFLVAVPDQINSHPVVSVYDSNNKLVFTDKGPKDSEFARVYRLLKLEGGYIRVSNADESGEGKSLVVE